MRIGIPRFGIHVFRPSSDDVSCLNNVHWNPPTLNTMSTGAVCIEVHLYHGGSLCVTISVINLGIHWPTVCTTCCQPVTANDWYRTLFFVFFFNIYIHTMNLMEKLNFCHAVAISWLKRKSNRVQSDKLNWNAVNKQVVEVSVFSHFLPVRKQDRDGTSITWW